jgi:hypothetical protein
MTHVFAINSCDPINPINVYACNQGAARIAQVPRGDVHMQPRNGQHACETTQL